VVIYEAAISPSLKFRESLNRRNSESIWELESPASGLAEMIGGPMGMQRNQAAEADQIGH
jgi:hypothetical protein